VKDRQGHATALLGVLNYVYDLGLPIMRVEHVDADEADRA